MIFRQMLDYDALGRYDLPKDIFIRIVRSVRSMKDEAPMATRP